MAAHQKPDRYLSRRHFLQWTGSLSSALLLTACTGTAPSSPAETPAETPGTTTGEPRRGGTLRVVLPGTVSSLDPAMSAGYDTFVLLMCMYEPLVTLDASRQVQPALAESWDVSEDGLEWIFKLRQGVTFHHGTPFTAQDVVHTYTRTLDPESGARYGQTLQFIERVTEIDESTVQFTLKSPNIELPYYLSFPPISIVPHDVDAEDLASMPSGTGPFRMAEYVPGDHAFVTRNENYWDAGRPYLDEVRHFYVPEPATQVAALTGGTADVIWQLGAESRAALEGNPDVDILEVAGGAHQPIYMVVTEPPFDDVRVRRALKHLTNRIDVRQAVLQGKGTLGNDQPVSTVSPYWADVPALEYDIERARALLAEAGYADGLELTLATTNARPGMLETAVVFQEMAKAAGVTMTLNQMPAATYFPVSPERHGNLAMDNWQLFPTDNLLLSLLYHSNGSVNLNTGWHTPEVDELIEAVRSEQDPDKRQEMYTRIQTVISQDGAVIIPYFGPVFSATSRSVQGLALHPDGMMDFSATWMVEA